MKPETPHSENIKSLVEVLLLLSKATLNRLIFERSLVDVESELRGGVETEARAKCNSDRSVKQS